jgi:glutaredoxin-related protein
MAFCVKCGQQVGDGVKFCANCGTPVAAQADPPQTAVAPKPAKEKIGNIKTCPACGATVESFQTRCMSCGHEFSGVDIVSSVKAFLKQLDAVDNAASSNEVKNEKKSALIKNFPIPNGKEDLLEFIILATSRLDAAYGQSGVDTEIIGPWEIKLNDAYKKAKIVFEEDKSAMAHTESLMAGYHKAVKEAGKRKSKRSIMRVVPVAVVLLIVVGGLFLIFRPTEAKRIKAEDNIVVKLKNAAGYDKIQAGKKTDRLNKLVVNKYGDALQFVPNDMKTDEVCIIAVSNDASAIQYVPEERKTPQMYESVVRKDGLTLKSVPESLLTEELCNIAVANRGTALQYVPDKFKTLELCTKAVSTSGEALQYVPDKFITLELCTNAVNKSGHALRYVPDKYKTPDFYAKAVNAQWYALQYVPDKLVTKDMCDVAMKEHGGSIEYVPARFITNQICMAAVQSHGMNLQYVPEEFKTLEVCAAAVRQWDGAMEYVPTALQKQVKDATR